MTSLDSGYSYCIISICLSNRPGILTSSPQMHIWKDLGEPRAWIYNLHLILCYQVCLPLCLHSVIFKVFLPQMTVFLFSFKSNHVNLKKLTVALHNSLFFHLFSHMNLIMSFMKHLNIPRPQLYTYRICYGKMQCDL